MNKGYSGELLFHLSGDCISPVFPIEAEPNLVKYTDYYGKAGEQNHANH